jgi:serine/threonine protein kinase
MIIEYLPGGDMCHLMTSLSKDHNRAFDLFTQVLDAVAHVHRHGLIHNDIKADNVLLSADGTPKLCDFGLACKTGHPLPGSGTYRYMAPELLTKYGERIIGVHASPTHDMWSLGITLFAMLTDGFPWRRALVEDSTYIMMLKVEFEMSCLDRTEQTVRLRFAFFFLSDS